MTFLGFERPDGTAGVRNYVLVIPGGFVASEICRGVPGTKSIVSADSGSGRTEKDRETIARTLVGLGRNPNSASVIVHGASLGAGYPELDPRFIADQIAESGKRVELLETRSEGTLEMTLRGIVLAREMVYEASKLRRKKFDDSYLTIGVKCGASDTTSGIAGNPVVGYAFDRLVEAGGTGFFGENTEIIGAEHILAKRGIDDRVAESIIEVARLTDQRAKSTGQDIRTVNPVPANIAGGLTTLEEKSLGAIVKAGSSPIQGVLRYAERPEGKGLYFVDCWMTMSSIFMGYAAAGAQLVLFQLGGGGMRGDRVFYMKGGIVAPLLWVTGNPKTRKTAGWNLDFYAPIIEGEETIQEAGERLYAMILDTASGTKAKSETLGYQGANQVYMTEPVF